MITPRSHGEHTKCASVGKHRSCYHARLHSFSSHARMFGIDFCAPIWRLDSTCPIHIASTWPLWAFPLHVPLRSHAHASRHFRLPSACIPPSLVLSMALRDTASRCARNTDEPLDVIFRSSTAVCTPVISLPQEILAPRALASSARLTLRWPSPPSKGIAICLYKPSAIKLSGVLRKKLLNLQPPRSGSISWTITIFRLASHAFRISRASDSPAKT